ncbi:hypothetical protein diail_10720 [Diaporthe ilicicola]|nr:hypothetical protein diail_10720 [Diaporthe ilicicola]
MHPTPQSVIDDRRSRQRQAALSCNEADIWSASQTQELHWGTARGFAFPLGSQYPEFFVKFTSIECKWFLDPERRNHEFAFETLREQRQPPAAQQKEFIVCVPEIFRSFEYRDFYFLAMEFVPGRTLGDILREEDAKGGEDQVDHSTLYKHIAEGIRLLSVKAPPEAKPGPVGGGIIRHPFFKDFEAATPYRDVEMLEAHLNKVSRTHQVLTEAISANEEERAESRARVQVLRLRTRRAPGPAPTVTFGKELEFYYSDLSAENFIFTDAAGHTVLYIIDFDEAGFLPPSFMTFVLHTPTRPTSILVAQNIVDLIKPTEDDELAMATASYFLLSSAYYFGELNPACSPCPAFCFATSSLLHLSQDAR